MCWRGVHDVTCLLPMKLNSGGAIPKPAHTRASSDTLLFGAALGWLEEEPGASPWGTFIFAAAGTENEDVGRRKERKWALVKFTKDRWTFWFPSLVAVKGYCTPVISCAPSFLDDRLLFCCWLPEAALLAASCVEGLPVPAPSIFSISFSTKVPFCTRHTL